MYKTNNNSDTINNNTNDTNIALKLFNAILATNNTTNTTNTTNNYTNDNTKCSQRTVLMH